MTGNQRQWLIVGLVVGGLALGAWALSRFGADTERVAIGAEAPDFMVRDLRTGDSINIAEHYRGRVTMLNIWATWCIPCRTEMPSMQQAYALLKDEGFAIAAVSIDEAGPDVVTAFSQEYGLTFDILHDRSGAIQRLFQITGVPETFLLDRDGVIIKRVIGPHDWASPANLALLRRALGAEPT